ncbi:hypothetical protein [Xylella fastidiosa]|uniref:hypothetical protein n=1 Tax=Xylella fastidiosa TaxID=2371 RepID=UPI0039848E18
MSNWRPRWRCRATNRHWSRLRWNAEYGPCGDEGFAAFHKLLVAQGLPPPKDGEPPPEPPAPDPVQLARVQKLSADAELSDARAQHQRADAETKHP